MLLRTLSLAIAFWWMMTAAADGFTHFSKRPPYLAPLHPLPPVDYDYRYTIDDVEGSGVATDRWERRQGDHVRGGYTLLEPDGRVRFVDYETDGATGGFKAVVRHATPAVRLLSTQQLYRSLAIHGDPLVNKMARRG